MTFIEVCCRFKNTPTKNYMSTNTKIPQPQHSSYWLPANFLQEVSEEDKNIKLFRLAAARRAISNFVTILCGYSIPVTYTDGKTSYTDGSRIVISATDSLDSFDTTVGLALHEASHVMLSDFYFLQSLAAIGDQLRNGAAPYEWAGMKRDAALDVSLMFCDGLRAIINATPDAAKDAVIVTMLADLHTIMNVLEDRRIDKYVYQTASGYQKYYDALYKEYFSGEEISKNLKYNPEWRELTVNNYINRLLLSINPDADPDALPGLREIIAIMDIDTIERVGVGQIPKITKEHLKKKNNNWITNPTFDGFPTLWKDANKIYAHILKFASLNPNTSLDASRNMIIDGIKVNPSILDGELIDISSIVFSPSSVEKLPPRNAIKKFNQEKINKILYKIRDFMDNKVNKKILSKAEIQKINAIDEANANIVDVSVSEGSGVPKIKCIVTRKITHNMMSQDWFPFGHSRVVDDTAAAITKGRRLGQILVNRLQVRNTPVTTKQVRLLSGNLERRMLYQLGMDIESVFSKSRTDSYRPAMLHLSIDASASMLSSSKWNNAATIAVALAYASTKINNIDVVITLRGGMSIPVVSVAFDSRKNSFAEFINIFKHLGARGNTPEGLCFKATMDMILEAKNTHDVYFVNFSDGEPNFHNNGVYYTGPLAIKHTEKVVSELRANGIFILSYFITDMENIDKGVKIAFTKMYKESASFINPENATSVTTTLNKLLTKKVA